MTEAEKVALNMLQSFQRELREKLGVRSRGISDLAAIDLSAEILAHVKTCIGSDDPLSINCGLYTLKGILRGKQIENLPEDFKKYLVERVAALVQQGSASVTTDALDWYCQLRDLYPNYRSQMLKHLASPDLAQRRIALRYYSTYAKAGEIDPLLGFRGDLYAGELRSLGDWEYELRNRALETIEDVLGRKFPGNVQSEPYEGTKVTWRDWTPFLEWWIANRPKV